MRRCFCGSISQFPNKIAVKVAFDNAIAHKIEAGADMFLMPSRYEPCGLNQIYSLKYGTVPIVRATGGLDDTIESWDARTGKGTGFKFSEYTGEALLATVKQALLAYRDPSSWKMLMRNGMSRDFSWGASAKEYVKVYERARHLQGTQPVSVSESKKGVAFELAGSGAGWSNPFWDCYNLKNAELNLRRKSNRRWKPQTILHAPSSTLTWTPSSFRSKNYLIPL